MTVVMLDAYNRLKIPYEFTRIKKQEFYMYKKNKRFLILEMVSDDVPSEVEMLERFKELLRVVFQKE